MVVSTPVEPSPSVAPTATENPVTLLGDHLTKDSHKSPLDKTLWAIAIAGLVSLAGPNNHITLAFRLLGFGSSLALLARNDEARKTRQLVTNALFHHGKSIDQAWADGAESGRVGALERAQVVVDKLQSQLVAANERIEELGAEAVRVQEQRLALDQRDRLGEAELQRQRLAFEQLKFEYQGEFDGLRATTETQQETIRQLQESLAEQNEAAKKAIAEALENQATRHQVKVTELEKEVLRLGAARELAAQRLELERSLPEAKDLIVEGKMLPILIVGQPGGGKGSSCLSLMQSYAEKFGGIIPIVYDPTQDSGWYEAGISPYGEGDRYRFFEAVQTLWNHRESRLNRNDPGFDLQEPIIIVIDEVEMLYMGMEWKGDDKATVESWHRLLARIDKGGGKYGIFTLYLSKSYQVKDMKFHNLEVVGSGLMRNMHVLLLNSQIEPFTTYPLGCKLKGSQIKDGHATGGDAEKLKALAGEYTAAIATSHYGARSLALVKHPTHYGQPLSQRSPSRPIFPPELASCPDYLSVWAQDKYYELRPQLRIEHEFRAERETDIETLRNPGETAIETAGETGIKPLRSVYSDDSPFAIETVETATPDLGAWWESEAVSRHERSLIIACREQGLSQKKAVKQIYGKSPGRSEKYRIAATKVKEVYSELSLVNGNAR